MSSGNVPLDIMPIADGDIDALIALWTRCDLVRPWNDPESDIALARQYMNSEILVGRQAGKLVASVQVGHDGHRGWLYYLAVEPVLHKSGHGRVMVAAAEDWLRDRGIPKVQLMVRAENTGVRSFYEKIGYAMAERINYARWLDGRKPTP